MSERKNVQQLQRWMACVGLGLAAIGASAQGRPSPPMGWNSWDAYGLTLTEPQFRANVEVLRDKLAPFGWRYAVIDEGWFFENPEDRDTPEKLRYALDAHGRYVPVPERFPSAAEHKQRHERGSEGSFPLAATIEETSFTELGKWVHAQGLKFGIHIVRGIPRASVERNLPIANSGFRAQDAADPGDACPWDPTNWGVRDNEAGQAWYDSLLKQYAAWGVDLLKVDCIADHPYKADEIRMIRRAMEKTKRPMVLSLSPGPTQLGHAAEVGSLANMWRISDDVWDVWKRADTEFPQTVHSQFARLNAWAVYTKSGPGTPMDLGNWPDADMLPLGELRPHPGWGEPRSSRLTAEEQRTQVTLWAVARSPLILGANLTLLDAATLALVTNKDVIAIDQTAYESKQTLGGIGANHGLVEWRARLPNGQVALAYFNLGDEPLQMLQAAAELAKPREVRDVWREKELGVMSRIVVELPPHGCKLYLLH